MKRILALICLAVCLVLGMSGCEEPALENYKPKEEEFEFAVLLDKTEYVKGEIIEYTVKVTRKSGPKFKFTGNIHLCHDYFELVGKDEKPSFVVSDALSVFVIPKDYQFEETYEIATKNKAAGQYVFAIWFCVKNIDYNYETVITIVDA